VCLLLYDCLISWFVETKSIIGCVISHVSRDSGISVEQLHGVFVCVFMSRNCVPLFGIILCVIWVIVQCLVLSL
jgi:hypothetical protein